MIRDLIARLRARHWMLATAESCTGGMIAAAITDIAGSSDVFDRGFVTYSNQAKTDMLGVPAALIARDGAVSETVAAAMAQGALVHSRADIAVSVTGVAGPGGGSARNPVGTVCFGLIQRDRDVQTFRRQFPGDRAAVRLATRDFAMELLHQSVTPSPPP